eukprot:9959945-Lingulodinium_polyedra.AAC.1
MLGPGAMIPHRWAARKALPRAHRTASADGVHRWSQPTTGSLGPGSRAQTPCPKRPRAGRRGQRSPADRSPESTLAPGRAAAR